MTIEPAIQPRRNLEQKFRCDDLERTQASALAAGAVHIETMHQRDVYFRAERGRLKLRSIVSDVHGESCELIGYDRPDGEGQRTCRYHLVAVSDPLGMERLLGQALGLRAIVAKRRRLLMSGSLRIHFDKVDGLGNFVEFEAVLRPEEDEEPGRMQITRWRNLLGLHESVPVSYVDLLEQLGSPHAPGAPSDANL